MSGGAAVWTRVVCGLVVISAFLSACLGGGVCFGEERSVTVRIEPDAALDILPIKPLEPVPCGSWRNYAYLLYFAVPLLLGAGILAYTRRKSVLRPVGSEDGPGLSIHDRLSEALRALQLMPFEGPEQALREGYATASLLLRRYLEEVLRVSALTRSTEEIEGMAFAQAGDGLTGVIEFLKVSDRVRFSDYMPARSEHDGVIEGIKDFLSRKQDIWG